MDTDPPPSQASASPMTESSSSSSARENEITHAGEPAAQQREGAMPEMPKDIEGYRILKEIGRGGMGLIYLAFEKACNREVALKVVPPGLSPRQLRRFLEEATITGQIQHPTVVPIYRMGKLPDGRDYYTMKRVQGRTLSQIHDAILDSDPKVKEEFGMRRRAAILQSVCEGVAFAHDQGVIHRDLKPSNIMIGSYGEVYVLDWGLARTLFGARQTDAHDQKDRQGQFDRHARLRSESTSIGRIVSGTPAYMSPEQARGETSGEDQRSDVWSLGAILYTTLTFHTPIEGKTADEKLVKAAQGRITPIEEHEEGRKAPRELVEIVRRALHPDPTQRYPSARGMAEDLKAYLDGRGRWQLAYQWTPSMGALSPAEWRTLLGKWKVDPRGLSPSELTRNGSVLLHQPSHTGDVRVEIKGFEQEQAQTEGEIGILIHAPEPATGVNETDGYCFRFGGPDRVARFARDAVEILEVSHRFLEPGRQHTLTVEAIDNRIRMEIDGEDVLDFYDLFPLTGARIGLFGGSSTSHIESIRIYHRGLDAKISCLSIPDHSFQRGRYTEAVTGYARIAEELAGREEGWLARFKAGLSRLKAEDPLGAESDFRPLEGTPGEVLAHLGRALISARESDFRRELMRLSAALRLAPAYHIYPFVLALTWNRAQALSTEGHFEAAIPFYNAILDAEPKGNSSRFRALQAISRCQFHLGYDDEALRSMEKLGQETDSKRSEHRDAYRYTVRHFRVKAKWQTALAISQQLAQRSDTAFLGHFLTAETEWVRGEQDRAQKALQLALDHLKEGKTHPHLMALRAHLALDRGQFEDAQHFLIEAIKQTKHVSPLEWVTPFAWIYVMRGKPDRGLAALARHLDSGVHVDRMAILAEIGALSMLRGDLEHAQDCLTQAQANLPTTSNPHLLQTCELRLGLLRLAKGESADAKACFQRAAAIPARGHRALLGKILQRWPKDEPLPEPPEPGHGCPWDKRAEYFYYLAEFARLSQRKDEAQRAYRRATIESPTPYRHYAWLSCLRLAEMGMKSTPPLPPFPPLR